MEKERKRNSFFQKLESWTEKNIKQLFQRSEDILVDKLNLRDGLLTYLFSEEIVGPEKKEQITSIRSRPDQVRELRSILDLAGKKFIIDFLRALPEKDHEHVLDAIIEKQEKGPQQTASTSQGTKREAVSDDASSSVHSEPKKTKTRDDDEYYKRVDKDGEEQNGYLIVVQNFFLTKEDEAKLKTKEERDHKRRISDGLVADKIALRDLFKGLKYERAIATNLNKDQCQEFLEDHARILKGKYSSEKYCCVVVAFLSHGGKEYKTRDANEEELEEIESQGGSEENSRIRIATEKEGVLMQDEEYLLFSDIVSIFNGTLPDKPKAFIFNCCRGHEKGKPLMLETGPYQSDIADRPITIPIEADSLSLYATTPDHVAFITPTGSHFIKSLVEVFNANHTTKDVVEMLTLINRETAKMEEGRAYDISKQMSEFRSRLRYKFEL